MKRPKINPAADEVIYIHTEKTSKSEPDRLVVQRGKHRPSGEIAARGTGNVDKDGVVTNFDITSFDLVNKTS